MSGMISESTGEPGEITVLLKRWQAGDDQALDALVPHIMHELYQQAKVHMYGERRNHTLTPTALLNEAYVTLFGKRASNWKNRDHFFRVSSLVMKHILSNHARDRSRQKRGGDWSQVHVENMDALGRFGVQLQEQFALIEALATLEEKGSRQAVIFWMSFAEGHTLMEIATILGASLSSVKRDLDFARSFLKKALKDHGITNA